MTRSQILAMPFSWIPESLHWENFLKAIKGNDGNWMFARNLANSLIVSITVAITTILIASITGYGIAKFKFRGKNIIFMMIMATMMIPFEAIMIPLYMVATALKMQDSYAGLIVPFLVSAFGVFQMRQYLTTFPTEFLDAARVDGMGELKFSENCISKLCTGYCDPRNPLLRGQWDNLLWPLLVTQSEKMKTIPSIFQNLQRRN